MPRNTREYDRRYAQTAKGKVLHKQASDRYRRRNAHRIYLRNQRWNKQIKDRVFLLLGERCVRCGFSDKRALQIDHIHGGGKRHIAKFKSWLKYMDYIVAHHEDFQILCANCNWIKRAEKGEGSGFRGHAERPLQYDDLLQPSLFGPQKAELGN